MCSLQGVITSGIVLAIFDILHGLATTGFYTYNLIMHTFYLCPLTMPVDLCHSKIYIFDQMFEYRVYIGIGEGIAGVFFAIIYIIALVKHKPYLTWVWLMKSFAVILLNIYYLAWWLFRQGYYEHINKEQTEDENVFIYAAEGLTLVQIVIMILFCLIGGIFTYKVVEERIASRRSLRQRRYIDASAPPLEYDEEEAQYLNDALTNSEKTIPARASKQSLTDISRADTFKHSTGV